VGCGVGCGVAVGGVGVGLGVGFVTGGGVGFGRPVTGSGVALGPRATVGEVGDGVGSADGATDGSLAGVAAGVSAGGVAVDGSVLADGSDGVLDPGVATATGGGDWRATPSTGGEGATAPAVSATVARMRLRTPMATTRRAR
jgi:hypothetical protein